MPNGQVLASFPENQGVLAVQGVAAQQVLALDAVSANDVGMWQPMLPFHKGSLEGLFDAGVSGGTVQLMVSNAASMPANGFAVTVGGAVTPGDVVGLLITSPALVLPGILGQYTVQVADTHNLIAAGLAAALQAAIKSARLHEIFGEQANLAAGAMLAKAVSAVVNVTWNYPLPSDATPVDLQKQLSGGATSTLTVAQYDSGEGFAVTGASLTASGNVAFDHPGTWMKTKLSSYAGSGNVSAIVQLVTP